MKCTLTESPAATILERLLAAADIQHLEHQHSPKPSQEAASLDTPFERFSAAKALYMPIDRPFGNLMYALIRASRPSTIVEFGTSFGISTIFLAAAVRDNGIGKVITTEFIAEKVATARLNLTEAGLVDLIEFRAGDAIQTLQEPLPGPVDFLFLDGEKSMYLDIVKLLEPHMKPGCLVLSDNTDHEGAETYVDYMREGSNGYISASLLTAGGPKQHSGHEVSVRL
jgi:predicted O-methyltransferase YrrM